MSASWRRDARPLGSENRKDTVAAAQAASKHDRSGRRQRLCGGPPQCVDQSRDRTSQRCRQLSRAGPGVGVLAAQPFGEPLIDRPRERPHLVETIRGCRSAEPVHLLLEFRHRRAFPAVLQHTLPVVEQVVRFLRK